MRGLLASAAILLLADGATASPMSAEKAGPWIFTAECDRAGPEECLKTMSQSDSNITVTIFRSPQRLELQASLRSCDREDEQVAMRRDAEEWEAIAPDMRTQLVRSQLSTWLEASRSGCSSIKRSHRFSLDQFDTLFTAFDSSGI